MEKKLSRKQILVVASTLFGMFFGAGNLIFPVHLGQLAGSNALAATIGFIVTAVTIPILGVAAIGSTHSDGLQELSSKVSRGYGYFFTCLLYLTIGPFFAIPRCATTSFTVGISALVPGANQSVILLFFSVMFFAVVLAFSLKPKGITTWIGRIINPVFLVFLGILVVAAMIHPGSSVSAVEPVSDYTSGAFFNGFIEGYGTMDAIAGLAFGIVVVDIIRSMGVQKDMDIARGVLRSGIYTGLLMALIYVLTIIMGAQSRGLFAVSENGGIALAQISNHYLGAIGSVVLALTITFACLKTAIGLVTSCSETFVKMFPGKLSYNAWVYCITGFSLLVSNVGLSKIISYSIPALMFIYPLAITLIILALTGRFFNHDGCVYRWVTGFALFAAIFDMLKTLPAGIQNALSLDKVTALAAKVLPFFNIGLGWLVPSVIGFVIGILIHISHKKA